MKLSINFGLDEFTRSNVASQYGIENVPGEEEIQNLTNLCKYVLQPIRDHVRLPISISSGYRCPELNSHPKIKGSATSDHVKGKAADIYATGMRARDLFNTIIKMGIEFDQLILYPTFVHISYRRGENRKQILYAKGVEP